jgi:ribonucleoside-diphosphate reductase subunit M2
MASTYDIDEIISETFLHISDLNIYEHFYTLQRLLNWYPNEVDCTKDRDHFNLLSPKEKNFINAIITYFLTSDKLVGDNAKSLTQNSIEIEKQAFLSAQTLVEFVHNETYTKMFRVINNITSNDKNFLKNILASEISPLFKFQSIINKRNFAKKYSQKTIPLPEKIAAFGIIECIFFSSSFSGIFWLKKRALCPGITTANEWILRDENLHWKFACYWLSQLIGKEISLLRVYEILNEAVEIELNFCEEILPESLGDMNCDDLKNYVKFMADSYLKTLKLDAIYKVNQPFDFMETFGYNIKDNFFEKKVTSYNKKIEGSFSFDKV